MNRPGEPMRDVHGLRLRPSVAAEAFSRTDWAATPLGPVPAWPRALREAVQLCLNSAFPMTVGWGESLTLVYNDGYLPILADKHPDAMGRPALDVYPEIEAFLGPSARRVLEYGEAIWEENTLLAMHRGSGLEEGYFTFCYSPLLDDEGRIGGVLSVASETTAAVVQQRRHRTVGQIAAAFAGVRSEQRLLPLLHAVLTENVDDFAAVALFDVGATAGPSAQARSAPRARYARPRDASSEIIEAGLLARAEARLRGDSGASARVERSACRWFVVPLMLDGSAGMADHLCFVLPGELVAADAEYERFLGVLRDLVTNAVVRLQMERAAFAALHRQLDDRERLYRLLFEQASEGVAIAEPDGTLLAANPALCDLLGYSEAELREVGYFGAVINDDGSLDRAVAEQTRSGRFDGQLRLRRKDGSALPVDVSSVVFRDEGSGSDRIVTLVHDATPRLLTQERITASARLEALGQLTGGVSHDFNNLLNVIIGGAEELMQELPEGGSGKGAAEMILSASLRAAELTRQLLAFSQRRPSEARLIGVGEVVRELHQFLDRVMGADIRLEVHALHDAEILADPTLLHSSLLNLCINARDAMVDGGTLTIEVDRVELDAGMAATLDVAPGTHAVIRVTDTGVGIPRDLIARVVEPYFTTKPAGRGSGLGLAMVYGFVRQCDGAVQITSVPGQGTQVHLYLPEAPRDQEPAASEAPVVTVRQGSGEHVLVVDDNDLVAEMLRAVLQRNGFRVTVRGHGEAALDVLAGGESVDLVMTDILLGEGMDGWELAREIRSRHAGLPVVTMSGYAPEGGPERPEGTHWPSLSKPFRPRDVLEVVSRALTAGE